MKRRTLWKNAAGLAAMAVLLWSSGGGRPAPLTGEDSLRVLKVIFAAYRASETGTAQKVR